MLHRPVFAKTFVLCELQSKNWSLAEVSSSAILVKCHQVGGHQTLLAHAAHALGQ